MDSGVGSPQPPDDAKASTSSSGSSSSNAGNALPRCEVRLTKLSKAQIEKLLGTPPKEEEKTKKKKKKKQRRSDRHRGDRSHRRRDSSSKQRSRGGASKKAQKVPKKKKQQVVKVVVPWSAPQLKTIKTKKKECSSFLRKNVFTPPKPPKPAILKKKREVRYRDIGPRYGCASFAAPPRQPTIPPPQAQPSMDFLFSAEQVSILRSLPKIPKRGTGGSPAKPKVEDMDKMRSPLEMVNMNITTEPVPLLPVSSYKVVVPPQAYASTSAANNGSGQKLLRVTAPPTPPSPAAPAKRASKFDRIALKDDQSSSSSDEADADDEPFVEEEVAEKPSPAWKRRLWGNPEAGSAGSSDIISMMSADLIVIPTAEENVHDKPETGLLDGMLNVDLLEDPRPPHQSNVDVKPEPAECTKTSGSDEDGDSPKKNKKKDAKTTRVVAPSPPLPQLEEEKVEEDSDNDDILLLHDEDDELRLPPESGTSSSSSSRRWRFPSKR